jgi:hypothetical protein
MPPRPAVDGSITSANTTLRLFGPFLLLDGTFGAGDTIHIGVADDQLSLH